ncbi:hypothetical protein [Thermococcus sp. MV11]|uniref:hypothetical protein n=1 Tax=Thermococcus sp. MV11 TaxID=1638267 RepID=UPI001431D1C6|nr:hypothetical protein [Thermococcus sp. MV11]
MSVGVYLDREAREIIQTVREKLARQLGVSEKHISASMVVKYLYSQSRLKMENSS